MFEFNSRGQLYIRLEWIGVKSFILHPWMAMAIGVFAILGVFRLYVLFNSRKNRTKYRMNQSGAGSSTALSPTSSYSFSFFGGGGGGDSVSSNSSQQQPNQNNNNTTTPNYRRKDSLVDPLLLLKQMINTKPKKFQDIFPEELRELAKRRVIVLKEKDPFQVSNLFPKLKRSTSAFNILNIPSSLGSPINQKNNLTTSANTISNSPGSMHSASATLKNSISFGGTSKGNNNLLAVNKPIFRTPQPIKPSEGSQTPSPLALTPNTFLDGNNELVPQKHDNSTIILLKPPQPNQNQSNNNNNNENNENNNLYIPNFINDTSTTNSDQPQIEEEVDNDQDSGDSIDNNSNSNSINFKLDNQNNNNTNNTNNNNENIHLIGNNNQNQNFTSSNSFNNHYQSKYSFFNNNNGILPSVDFGLVGLALSGGGIRSATFNLGLLQALTKHKLFRKVDYLSTVSGGGFIGSCLISLLSEGTHTPEWKNFPFHYSRGMKEGVPLKHLRNSANYLANGIFEFLLFPVLILRGIVLNLISIFPFVWSLLLFERFIPMHFGAQTGNYYLSIRIAWNLLIHIIIFPLIARPKVTIPAISLFLIVYHRELSHFFALFSNLEMGLSLILHLYLNHPFLLRKEDSKVWYDHSFGWLFIVLLSSAFVESLPIIERHYLFYFGANDQSIRVYPLICLFALILADSLAFTLLTNPKLSSVKRLVFHIIVSVIGPLLLILTYLELSVWIDRDSSLFGFGNGLCLFVSLLSFFTMDINETSMHKYYRDKLSKAYMFSIKNGRFRPYGGEKISRINRRSVAPYLLINTTLNYTSNTNEIRSTSDIPNDSRGSDFFIFSQHFVGSETCGYRSTPQMEKLDRRLDLATAVSISGAAVGTKMGTATIPTLVLSLGILNIRLGYWLPNPLGIFLSHPYLGRLFYGGFACYHLVKEFGWTHMTSKDWCINLSDGGHIENLGAYELIKRKCKFIIISDCEADPDMTFGSMAQLMRLVRIDFGINIEINLDDIRRGANGYSKKHWTVGKIIYQKKKKSDIDNDSFSSMDRDGGGGSNDEFGYLLYIKSSLTGDEDEVIKEYQSQHQSFPHESTTDQFFSESQFEAYRSLGYHIGGSTLFGTKQDRLFNGEDLESFFEKLYQKSTSNI